jgi:hypothetical protein
VSVTRLTTLLVVRSTASNMRKLILLSLLLSGCRTISGTLIETNIDHDATSSVGTAKNCVPIVIIYSVNSKGSPEVAMPTGIPCQTGIASDNANSPAK